VMDGTANGPSSLFVAAQITTANTRGSIFVNNDGGVHELGFTRADNQKYGA